MENIDNIKENRPKRSKKTLIIILIIIPLIILSILFRTNNKFKIKANAFLEKLPGVTGDYFRSSPTDLEKKIMKSELADYYLSLSPDVAADKLYIIKKDDDKLYQDIIKLMNSISSSKTTEIIELVRKIELRRDLLVSIYDEIQFEKENFLIEEAARFEDQNLILTISEIKNRFEKDQEFKENMSNIINLMNESKVVDLLYYLDDNIKDEILNSINTLKRTSIEKKLLAKKTEQAKLEDLANLYKSKSIKLAIEEIGNIDSFNVKELAIIYKNLPILKSAEILSNIDDKEFIQELFTAIKMEEQLLGEEESVINDISKSMDFITEYNSKIDDLVLIYEKMRPDKISKIAEKMLVNDSTVTVFEINSEPVFKISDASIMVDVLSRLGNKTLSNVMNNMSDTKASSLTQLLAKTAIKPGEVSIEEGDIALESTTEYNKKIDELVAVYENLKPDHAAKIVENMMKNNNTTSIIVDILSKMQGRNLSNIMNNLKEDQVSKLTQMLVK